MFLPQLKATDAEREMIGEFRGYNHNLRIRDNEFYDMANMSSNLYPVLSPRGRRARARRLTKPNGLFAHDRLCWVDGTGFYYGGEQKGTVADSPKQMAAMGAYVLIWPDKAYYNTHTGEFGQLGCKVTVQGGVTAALCRLDGTAYEGYTVSDTAPVAPENGALWVDTGGERQTLKQYAAASGLWISIPTAYTKITGTGLGAGFAEYDGVTLSGMEEETLNGDFILYGAGDDYVIVTAVISRAVSQSGPVTIERKIPDMDYITESENRLWGCSSQKHEIYACKLGDPKNWNCFMGISTDSYAMTVGSGGDFTGACTHLGYVLFFKEDVIHRIYGAKPANYQLTNVESRGVEKGSEKSLVIVNETLYYKSAQDVCAFQSALPASISYPLGQTAYHHATAGALGSKYYLSAKDADGAGVLLVYDGARGLWHKEDGIYALWFAGTGRDLYFINEADGWLYSVMGDAESYAGDGAALEGTVSWSAETGDIGLKSPDYQYISKIQLRMELDAGATVELALDGGDGQWETKFTASAARKRSFTAPIIPRRCDSMRLKIAGSGGCRIYSLTKTIEQGSEL
ncbi:hypothetical protein [Oscillibacter sp.]|uniref:hypothetical protein n=1 Tax=Oscillibacter sp. TaxID=1945593 RepID=UPI001B558CA4|nr:hypothetical protein [Oscillibacter sp.]MBP3509820.1 hypothetical protein [Oscillibacter sp.]